MLAAVALYAQQEQQYLIREGTRPKDVFTFSDIYLYPTFKPGKVTFKNGNVANPMLNYNQFTHEIDFIKDRKDTLALADAETVKSISIADDTFYFQVDIGFVKKLEQTPVGILAKTDNLQLADRRRHSNSGSSNSSSNGSYNNFNTNSVTASSLSLNMVEKIDLIYRRKSEYFIANSKGFFHEATKKNFIRLFPDKKNIINDYFESRKIDVKSEQDLLELFQIINEKI